MVRSQEGRVSVGGGLNPGMGFPAFAEDRPSGVYAAGVHAVFVQRNRIGAVRRHCGQHPFLKPDAHNRNGLPARGGKAQRVQDAHQVRAMPADRGLRNSSTLGQSVAD